MENVVEKYIFLKSVIIREWIPIILTEIHLRSY